MGLHLTALLALGLATAPLPTPNAPADYTHSPGVVRSHTGEGCHTYDWWDGYDICIMVWGDGLNVQQVEGWVDGRFGAPDLVHLYTTDGDLSSEEWLDGNGEAWWSWTIGGGIWLANYQNICFQDVTINQTACIYLDVPDIRTPAV